MISIIVAIGKNNVIGLDNKLPWHYKEDLKYFKEITTNHTVVMGRKTFESIISRNGKALPNRHNVVVTRDVSFKFAGVEVINDIDQYLNSNKNYEEEIFIIGGKEIYLLSLDYADKLYITWVNKEYLGDTYFPKIDFNKFTLINENKIEDLTFAVYERRN